ncbi:NUDIX domain-containing protein [Streptomyces harbinensis]|uniref:ADP-ribose pyrophosphatase YjhB, NUDIX family n=1 Tax=Streptomyces harbinensis TaxID=1176198 RepID=A0A1I6U4J4_9ACTN|nr:NUDIX hydrolase [Streptomyces harbinensis]SFS96355.1 ADP-ribose pyrophosphatase YjhB, NUDIX family [Streptomyces harbinensis]
MTTDQQPHALATGPLDVRLLALEPGPEERTFGDAPVTYALVALRHEGRLLLVLERERGTWELPGGGIDPGETPRVAAARELREEAGQVIAPEALRFVGFSKTAFADRPVAYGAVFAAETTAVRPFTPNEEIAAIHWWSGEPEIPGGLLQTVDTYLAERARSTPPA